ncbi:hypothetical protein RHMOL_Rhmol03G0131400 [Rhododendron molle]|uniref:Uncharacterized protein n=1 Tax=Rhododendron molle TaxID=49168 RepID=A0ACC0PG24_RHOML|nr:hypothetical protein RHMOL_Rhmol03G0131400 [Rhododendron molle]
MANSVRVAAAQMTSINDLGANFASCSRLVKEASAAGAKLLCFPENFSYVGAKDGDSLKIAESLDGPIMKGYCSLARESSIWLSLGGFQEKGSDDAHLRNTHVLIDDAGNIRSTYSKMFLFDVDVPGGMVFKESSFTEADSPFGRLGVTVCYDLRFPELYQQLRFNHEAQVIAAAQAGKHNDKRESYGDTMIIDPWGTVVGRLPDHSEYGKQFSVPNVLCGTRNGMRPTLANPFLTVTLDFSVSDRLSMGITVADIDFSLIDSVRAKMPISKHRKPAEFWKSAGLC